MTALRLLAPSLFCIIAAALVAPAASAQFNLTGSWEGRWSCQGFDGAKFRTSNGQSKVLITQTGNTLAVDMDDGDFRYNGGAIPDEGLPDKKGEVVLVQCGTDRFPLAGSEGELLRARVKVNAEAGTGTLRGLSILESAIPDVLTCKYSYRRTSPDNPAVAGCP